MNNNMVENPKTEVPATSNMNDCNYLHDILTTEKCLSNNLSTALSEASNEQLYDSLLPMFNQAKAAAHDTFNLLFKNGWYPLEKAETTKIQQKSTELTEKLQQLSN